MLDYMTFDELPENWPEIPLTHPRHGADIVDLVVGERDRRNNTLGLLLCDDHARLVRPILIGQIDWRCLPEERRRSFDWLRELDADGGLGEIAGVVVVVSHRSPRVRGSDTAWARTAERCLDPLGLALFGCFVAHAQGVQAIAPLRGQAA